MTTKHITDVLKELNENPELLKTAYKKNGSNSPLELLFQYAFLPSKKFLLPEDEPPFKKDSAPLGMSPVRFISEVKKFNLFCRSDISSSKRENIFIQLCESIHPSEAKILIAIKDQQLQKLYPNITYAKLADAGYLPALKETERPLGGQGTGEQSRPRARKKTAEAV
jgi:hypothetical protein